MWSLLFASQQSPLQCTSAPKDTVLAEQQLASLIWRGRKAAWHFLWASFLKREAASLSTATKISRTKQITSKYLSRCEVLLILFSAGQKSLCHIKIIFLLHEENGKCCKSHKYSLFLLQNKKHSAHPPAALPAL